MNTYDVVVIGAGPAGLAAATESSNRGAKTLLIEREGRSGGILKQCIHDGFGIVTFNERLTGPEYAERFIKRLKETNAEVMVSTYVSSIEEHDGLFLLNLVNACQGEFQVQGRNLIMANGCRERTSKQIFMNGTRPAGVLTAGTAQHFVNLMGYLPGERCIVLGSGDIGLIMARRLTLEGAKVLGVYEAKPVPSGLARNIAQCLQDYNIPLHLSRTVTRVFGEDRVTGVETCSVDENMKPVPGTEEQVECDCVVLSVGLIPENELCESMGVKLDFRTKGPMVDQNFMTLKEGVFSCGNALHVNDLVDYVSESGALAAIHATERLTSCNFRKLLPVELKGEFLYCVPQYVDVDSTNKKMTVYFRARKEMKKTSVSMKVDGQIVWTKKYNKLKPPEMERAQVDLSKIKLQENSHIELVMEELK